MSESKRPDIVKDEHLEYLDGLRKSSVTNMFGAGSYVQEELRVFSIFQQE